MVNWSSPQEIVRDTTVYENVVYVLFGLYVWELFQTSSFEWSLVTRARKFAWPLIPFFFCRYCLLWALIGLLISFSSLKHVNCQALYTFNSWTGNMAILCASTSLMLRTIALWEKKLKVVIPLGVLCLAHWTLLWRGMFVVKATYETSTESCVVTYTNHIFLNISFFATMVFDLIILSLTMAKLVPLSTRLGIVRLLFHDGLIYFLVAFAFNALPAILATINLNPVMNIIATIPAATFSAIAACRAVIRLQTYAGGDVYMHSSGVERAPIIRMSAIPHVTVPPPLRLASGGKRSFSYARPEVHVTTDQFVVKDFTTSDGDISEDKRGDFGTENCERGSVDLHSETV